MKILSVLLLCFFAFPLASASSCDDSPAGWLDAVENDCDWYAEYPNLRCRLSRTFRINFRSQASRVCCACGGGVERPDEPDIDYTGKYYMRAVQSNRFLIANAQGQVRLGYRNINAVIEVEKLFSISFDDTYALKSTRSSRSPYITINEDGSVSTTSSISPFEVRPQSDDGMTVHFYNPATGRTLEGLFNAVTSTESDNSGMADFQLIKIEDSELLDEEDTSKVE